MSGPGLAVSHPVIRDVVRRAALEVPGVMRVGRGGPAWRRALSGRAVRVRLRDGVVDARIVVVRSVNIETSMPDARAVLSWGRRALMRSTTWMMFAPGCL